MNTPDTKAGELTETIMARWLGRLEERREPRPNTATYNAAYEAVLQTLTDNLPPNKAGR